MRLDQQLARALGWAGVGIGLRGALHPRRSADRTHSKQPRRDLERGTIKVQQSVAVQMSAEELYRFWRDLERIPLVMRHVLSIRRIDERRSLWVARGPGGRKLEWESEVIADEPNRLLAWRGHQDGKPVTEDRLRFEPLPHGRGTRVTIELDYPAATATGVHGPLRALLAGGPQRQLKEDLRRFRQLMETGEIATTAGQPAGRRSLIARTLP